MKHSGVILISFLFSLFFYVEESNAQLTYISPKPGSKFHAGGTKIILKFGPDIKNNDLKTTANYQLIGDIAGNYNFKVVLAEKGNTIILDPEMDFRPSEHITIYIKNINNNEESLLQEHFTFDFQISGNENANEQKGNQANFYKQGNAIKDTVLPPLFPSITSYEYEQTSEGSVFFCNQPGTLDEAGFIAIVNNQGNPVFCRQMQSVSDGICFDLQKNGYMTYWDTYNVCFLMMDSTYNIIDTLRCDYGYTTNFHECRVLENNYAFLIAYDPQYIDMSEYISGGNPNAKVDGLIIQELDSERNIIFQWRSWDYFSILDATQMGTFSSNYIDYVHGNSIDFDTVGNIIVSCRNMDEITKIDINTGNIIWRMGGKNNQFDFVDDPERFSRQHTVRYTDDGNITLFDNGIYHTTPLSSAKIYSIDEVNMTVTLLWKFHHPLNYSLGKYGSVQQLPNGNVFINWASVSGNASPAFTEVKPDYTIVYEMYFNNANSFYRSSRRLWENPFDTLILGKKTINQPQIDVSVFPNPASGQVNIYVKNSSAKQINVNLYSINGVKMNVSAQTFQTESLTCVVLNTSELEKGVYYIYCAIGENRYVQKLIIY